MVWPSQLMRCMVASPGCTAVVCIPRLFIPLGSPPRHSGHSCTQIGRTRAKPAPNDAELDVPGIVIAEVVGGVAGCLSAIAGAVILCKAWRALVVKRGDRNHREPLLTANGTDVVVLGGGTAAAATQGCHAGRWSRPRTGPVRCFRAGAAAVVGAATAAALIGADVVKGVFEVCACVGACAYQRARVSVCGVHSSLAVAHIRLRRATARWVPTAQPRTSRLDGVVRPHISLRRRFAARAVRQDDVRRRDEAQGRVQPGGAQQGALHGAGRVRRAPHPMSFVHESVRRAHVACECVKPAGGSKGSAPY
jgi:hypothetical protein